jgi:hypothetical protein
MLLYLYGRIFDGQFNRKDNKPAYGPSTRELMTDLRYLDRALRDRVIVSKGKLRIRRVNLGNLTNMEKNEYRIFLARSKRLTHLER